MNLAWSTGAVMTLPVSAVMRKIIGWILTFDRWKMLNVEGSMTTGASEQDVVNVVHTRHVDRNDGVRTTISDTLLLLLLGGETLSQWLRHWAFLMAHGTLAQMRRNVVFAVSNTKTAAALENEVTFVDLSDKMFSTTPRTKATLVVRCGATLAKDQGPLLRVILVVAAGIAACKVALPEFVVVRNYTERLPGSSIFLPPRSVTCGLRNVVLESLPQVLSERLPFTP
jgi:hypothetical protein